MLYSSKHPTADCVFYLYEFGKKANTTLELGVGHGVSTLALLVAASETGGTVYSVDINPCRQVAKNVRDTGLSEHWHFTCMNDLDYARQWAEKPIDLLFIDTVHSERQTSKELCAYAPLSKNILLHDTLETDVQYGVLYGVMEAVKHYMKEDPSFQFIELRTKHGLGWLRRI